MPKVRYQLLLLAFVVLGVYYPVIFAPFCSTDDCRLIDTLWNQDGFSLVGTLFPHGTGQYYRPLIIASFVADKLLWGLEPSFMHLENLLLHLCNTFLVYAAARELFGVWKREGATWAPLAAALIFALHPINTEAVSWVSGRTDPLAAVFVLGSLWSLGRYLSGRSTLIGLLPGFFILVGGLAKETALFFAPGALFLLLCWDRSFNREQSVSVRAGRLALPGLSIVIGAAGYLAMRSAALSVHDKGTTAVVSVVSGPGVDYFGIARGITKAMGFYLKKMFLPLPLNFGIVQVSNYYIVLGVLFFLLIAYLLYLRSFTSALTISAFCVLAPSFLLTFSAMSWTPVAERYLYIPCAMFAILAASFAVNLSSRSNVNRPVLMTFFFLLLSGSAYATTTRSLLWQDNYLLFADTARKSPSFNAAKNDMAVELLKRGHKEEAFKIFRTTPVGNYQVASLNIVTVLIDEGKLMEARELLYARRQEGAGYTPRMTALLVKVAELRRDQAKTAKEKLALDQELLQLIRQQYDQSKDPFFLYRLGLVQLRLNDPKGAFASFSASRNAAPPGASYRPAVIQLAKRFRP